MGRYFLRSGVSLCRDRPVLAQVCRLHVYAAVRASFRICRQLVCTQLAKSTRIAFFFFFVFHSTFWLFFAFSFVTSTLSLSSRLGGVFHQNNPCCVRKRRTGCRTFFFLCLLSCFSCCFDVSFFSPSLSSLLHTTSVSIAQKSHLVRSFLSIHVFLFSRSCFGSNAKQTKKKKRLLFPFFSPDAYLLFRCEKVLVFNLYRSKKKKKERKKKKRSSFFFPTVSFVTEEWGQSFYTHIYIYRSHYIHN